MACSREMDTPLMLYTELHCKTNYSFLQGASHPDELIQRAQQLGYTSLAITDRNSLAALSVPTPQPVTWSSA